MSRKLLEEQWKTFSRVIPKDAPAVQYKEMRRAFYAGAESILFRVIAAFAPETEPTEADLQIMDDVHQEIKDFAAAVARGEA